MKMKNLKKRLISLGLAIMVACTVVPALPANAAVKKLSQADFKCQVNVEKGTYNYEKGKFVSTGGKWKTHNYASEIGACGYAFVTPKVSTEIPNTQSYVSQTGYTSEGWETNFKTSRGIKKNSTKKQVVAAYGKGTVVKIKNDKFMTFYKNSNAVIYENVCAMKNYQYAIEYTYAKKSSEKWTIRFYFDKSDKCKAVLYSKKLSTYLKKTTAASPFKMSFAAPKGKTIATKTIAGHKVKVLPKNSSLKLSGNRNVYDVNVLYYDKQGKLLGRYGEGLCDGGKMYNDFLNFAGTPRKNSFFDAPSAIANKIANNYAYTKIIVQTNYVSGGKYYPYKANVYYVDARKCTY